MDLGIAGALSGAGEAGSKALGIAQVQYGAQKLEDSRQALEDLRQQRLFEHQKALQTQTEAAAEKRLRITEAGATSRLGISEAGADKRLGITESGADRRQRAALTNAKEINAATNATHLAVAKLQRELQAKQFDKTFTQAKLSALQGTIRELGNEITRLSVVVSNPLADKTDPSYKAALLQLESATKLHNLYAKQVGLEMNIPEEKIDTSITKPPFKMPSMGRTPGVIETPMPSAQEQEEMGRALQ